MIHRHVIITGGSSGIGLSLAKQLFVKGYHVSIIARDYNKLANAIIEIKANLNSFDNEVSYFIADVSNREQLEGAIDLSIEKFGKPELVISSAGIAETNYFTKLNIDQFERSMQINYFGTLYLTKYVVNKMSDSNNDRVVLISSLAGVTGIYGYSCSGPTKFAIRGLAESLRLEFKQKNIGI